MSSVMTTPPSSPLSPLAELRIADSHFLGFCTTVQNKEEARTFQATLKNLHSDAAHVPMMMMIIATSTSDDDDDTTATTNINNHNTEVDEDGEPPQSIAPGMRQEWQAFRKEHGNAFATTTIVSTTTTSERIDAVVVVVIVRYFGAQLLGVTCGRLGQCYQSIVRQTLHRFFVFPNNNSIPMEMDFVSTGRNNRDVYGMGAGDCELILNAINNDDGKNNKNELVQTLLSELQFDGFKGAAGEELPRLQNLQADLSQGVIPIYRYPGNYSGDEWMTFDWSPTSLRLKKAVEDTLQPLVHQTMNHCVTNYYRYGNDFIGHHSDKDLDLNRQGVIVSLSLGEERTLELRRRAVPQDVHRVRLPHGSMLVLGPNTNREWTHSILPKEDSAGVRLSLTLREVKTFRDLSTGRLFGQGVEDRTLKQVRTRDRVEKVALLSGFCVLSGLFALPSRGGSRSKSLLLVGSFGAGAVGLRFLSSLWQRKSDERAARAFFTKMSLTGTKY